MWAGVLAEDMNQTIWKESQCLMECGIGNGGDEHKTMETASVSEYCEGCRVGAPLNQYGYHTMHVGWIDDKRTPFFPREATRLYKCAAPSPRLGVSALDKP